MNRDDKNLNGAVNENEFESAAPAEIKTRPVAEGLAGEIDDGESGADPEDVFVKQKNISEELFEWLEIFGRVLAVIIVIFTFVFKIVVVQGPSMMYTLIEKDYLIISHLFYSPKPQDIVVIQVPDFSDKMPIIKRVIAVEGQTVDIDFETWTVTVDGIPIDEPYVNHEQGRFMDMDGLGFDDLPLVVEKGKIFVMGDNRNHSTDSRNSAVGQVDVRNVVGKAVIRLYPVNKFGTIKPNTAEKQSG